MIDTPTRRPTGTLVVNLLRHGQVVDRFVGRNLVVDGYKRLQARLLGGDDAGHTITQIGFGTNGSATEPGNTSLSGTFLKAVDGVTYPADNQVRFAFSLGASEAVGLSISEFGLLTGDGTLYARKVRPTPLLKDGVLSLSGYWTIEF